MKIYATTGVQRITDPFCWRETSSFYHQTTTNFTKYYGPGTQWGVATVNDGVAPAANTLYAYPFVFETPVTIADLAMYVTATSADGFRFGLYSNISDACLYPNRRLLDSGAQTGAVGGVVAYTANLTVTQGLYWFVSVFQSVAGPSFRRYEATAALGACWGALGTPNVSTNTTGVLQIGWSVPFTFGTAFPEVFPSSDNAATPVGAQPVVAQVGTTPVPVVLARLA